jgi:hypothetical protein
VNTTSTLARCESESGDGFAHIVREILSERWPDHGDAETVAADLTETTELIAAAYAPRIAMVRQLAERRQSEMRTLADRDRALHALLLQAKKSAGLFLDGQQRATVWAEAVQATLDRIRHKLEDVRAQGTEMVSLAELLPLLSTSPAPEASRAPVVVAIQPDRTWTMGSFKATASDESTPLTHYAFVGWSVVLHSTVPRTVLEPVFLIEGQAITQTGLLRNGLVLVQLL